MRKLIIDSIISLDGYFTDPRNNIDWFDFDTGEQEWSIDILRRVDTIVLGRKTYEEFSTFWPTPRPEEVGFDPNLTRQLRETPKIVFSQTLTNASWKPSTVMKENPSKVISQMKQKPGKDIVVLGSGSLVAVFAREGLIDEYWIRIRPIILGAGRPLFPDPNARHPLKLLSSQAFSNGVLGVRYEPIQSS